jgi:hypothetical protein
MTLSQDEKTVLRKAAHEAADDCAANDPTLVKRFNDRVTDWLVSTLDGCPDVEEVGRMIQLDFVPENYEEIELAWRYFKFQMSVRLHELKGTTP